MKAVFLGTPDLSVPSLEAVLCSHDVRLVVTQPDRPRGRGRKAAAPPVKTFAVKSGLPLWQPETVRGDEARRQLVATGAEILVVVAYGLFLPKALLEAFPHGAVNLHFSLLPAYRGAAPINWALINGEKVTGVSTFRLTAKMDAGPLYLQREVQVDPGETAGELAGRLAAVGAEVLDETLGGIERGSLETSAQDESRVSFAPKLGKEDGRIDWNRPAGTVVDHIRGVCPWPGAFTGFGESRLKVWKAAEVLIDASAEKALPGKVLHASAREGLFVAAGEGAVALEEIQPEGKRRMLSKEYLAGHPMPEGTRLI